MAESTKHPPHGNVPERVTDYGDDDNKKERDDPTEAESQEESEEETLPFRACDDRTIETNGLRKFSKNLDLEKGKSVAGELTPVCDGKGGGAETKELAIRVKARHGTGGNHEVGRAVGGVMFVADVRARGCECSAVGHWSDGGIGLRLSRGPALAGSKCVI